ncbi:MAG: T9SS type A sorting domain-containing protein [Candidatus Delongbacteria bacterium]|nr:T9SS type A sorting domain-containing protein [Candidatus Delongbacteria bacterium]
MKRILLTLVTMIAMHWCMEAQVVIQGTLSANTRLSAENTYLLKGFVRVDSGVTLTIEPGTMILGENASQGSLIVLPGGKIIAQGTPEKPIVFTSEFAVYGSSRTPTYGDWGGIILLGRAPINVPGGTASIEGPGDSYGGSDPQDSSGVMQYVRIEYPGIAFSPNNEINGLTFGGVGSRTVIDHIQVSYSGDDSYEWFGGSVNCKYLIAYRGWDDDFDSDFGYSGKLQYLVSLRDPAVADQSSSNGFESDNDGTGSFNQPITSPTWSNVTLIGPKDGTGSAINSNYKRGMHLRRNSHNRIYNALIVGWPTGVYLDGSGTGAGADSNSCFLKNSIIAGCDKGVDSTKTGLVKDWGAWFTGTHQGRILSTAGEVKLNRAFDLSNPDVMPTTGSPVLSGAAVPPANGFFDTTAVFVGAFGYTDWTAGWANWNPMGYPVGTDYNNPVSIEGTISGTMTLTPDKSYILKGFVRIVDGGVLTILPGTVIYGENSSQGSLIVQPGGKIIAQGTQNYPIVFTSEFKKPNSVQTPTYGDWGGIILLGRAPINVPGGTASIEGPGDSYGGSDPQDSSGVMQYVRIEYPGIAFSPNNEINGLTFGGVGSRTVIDHIQVSYSGDDSYEWFGGSVNCKYLIAYRGWDDDFDSDFGYSGKLQYLVSLRDPAVADQSSSNGFESDNDGTGSFNQPITSPTWSNVTLIGPKDGTGSAINSNYKRGMHLRRNSHNRIYNALIVGWPTGVYLDGSGTGAGADSNSCFLKNSIIAGCDKGVDSTKTGLVKDWGAWFTGTHQGRILSTAGEVKLNRAFDLSNPDVMPTTGSPVLSGAAVPPSNGFFDTTAVFVGAFGYTDWTAGWADFSGSGGTSGMDDGEQVIDKSMNLLQNYPNPFNPTTTIRYSLERAGHINLSIYNITGQKVAELVNDYQPAGSYVVEWNAEQVSTGLYFYRLDSDHRKISRKMMLIR